MTRDILEQLAAACADSERRIADKRRMPGYQRYEMTDLHRAFLFLKDLAYHKDWTRDDLIRLIDHVMAEAARERAEEEAEEDDVAG